MNMTRTTALLTSLCAAWCLCACGPSTSEPLPDWPALEDILLEPETVAQYYDEDDLYEESGGSLRIREQGLVGDEPVLLGHLRQGLMISNEMTRSGLLVMREIALSEPPMSYDDDRAVWETDRDGTTLTLILERHPDDDLRWNYDLLVRPEEGTPRLLVAGWFRPEGRDDGRQTGSGLIRYDYDAFSSLPGNNAPVRGVSSFAFRTTARGDLRLHIVMDGFSSRIAPTPLKARYAYTLRPNGSGEFRYLLEADIFRNVEGDETVGETVIWLPNRAAKGKALVSNPDQVAGPELRIDECWSPQAGQVWVEFEPDRLGESDGNEDDCVGRLATIQLEDPDLTVPPRGELPVVPERE